MTHLCITVCWLDDRYHGLLNREGPPEWPPSPFRLFQALVAGVARYGELDSPAGQSLRWLESLRAPLIIAPSTCNGQVIKRFVPNNDGDAEPDRQKRLTSKTSRPTILLGSSEIHYLWPVAEAASETAGVVRAANMLTCLGWGIDMAYANASLLSGEAVEALPGIRWTPKPSFRDDGQLRIPIGGSTMDLVRAHESALKRIEHGQPLRTVEKPRVFDRTFYTSEQRPIGRPCMIFALRKVSDEGYAYQHEKLTHIAGMTRCAAIKAMLAFPPESVNQPEYWVKSFVRGFKSDVTKEHRQFSYVPLPSIGHEHADAAIRRVMVMAPFGCEAELMHLASQLDGEQLEPEGGGEGPVLDRVRSDGVTRQYTGSSKLWATVTPVILPGHDDQKPAKTIKLIERALAQSGIEQKCQFTWGAMPNFNNCLSSHNLRSGRAGYYRPNHLDGLTAVHLRLTFEQPITGPLVVGAGRHSGFGLFAVNGG